MNDKLKAVTLCLLVIAALIVASAFIPVDSQFADNPYPQLDTPEPYHPQAYPEPETTVPTKEPREKKEKPKPTKDSYRPTSAPDDSL